MTITIVGHGYVGLVTACVFADFGNTVWVIGRTPEKITQLKNGDPLIYEPGLEELLDRNLKAHRLKFTLDYNPAIAESELVFIAVGTPSGQNGEADLSQVMEVAEKIGQNLADKYTVVSCKSTVPVGTNLKVKAIIENVKSAGAKFDMASCPEFLREGTGIEDTLRPDRVVVGVENQRAAEVVLQLHESVPGERFITDLASAELIKYASNSMLATKISFANLISFYAEKCGANVEDVLKAVGSDKRIGPMFLNPGIGYGGACFPKDVKALAHTGKTLGVDVSLLEDVGMINQQAKQNLVDKVLAHDPGKKLAIWGLSFKPNTDDIREAPSKYILQKLLDQGFELIVYDQEALDHIKNLFADKLTYAADPYQAVDGADALCILTDWNEFKQIDLEKVKKLLNKPVIFDGRNVYDPQDMADLGFTYYSVGRKTV